MVISVSYHGEVTKLQGLSSLACGPFDRWEWYRELVQGGLTPCIALAEDGEQQAALALMRMPGRMEALRNWFSFTWRPLAPEGEIGDRLLAALARDLKGRAPRIVLSPVPEEDGSAARLVAAFRAAGWRVHDQICDENHVLPVAGRTFAEYWAARPGAMRTTLKRKGARVQTEVLTSFDEAAWRAYRAVYEQSWKPSEERADILEAFARAEGASGRLRLGLAYFEGGPVAAQFWTVEKGIAYIHKLAHSEAAKPLSAGSTLSAALFRHVIDEDRVELIDFGTGRDAYKREWMEVVRLRHRLTLLDPTNPRVWPALAKRALARLVRRR